MKTYQSFAKTTENGQLVLTEIKMKNKKLAYKWFENNTVEYEKIYLK